MVDGDGVEIHQVQPDFPFYECRNAACCEVEDQHTPFVYCPTCSDAKYCSTACLELDSKRHERECLRVPRSPGGTAIAGCSVCVR